MKNIKTNILKKINNTTKRNGIITIIYFHSTYKYFKFNTFYYSMRKTQNKETLKPIFKWNKISEEEIKQYESNEKYLHMENLNFTIGVKVYLKIKSPIRIFSLPIHESFNLPIDKYNSRIFLYETKTNGTNKIKQ